MIELILYFLFCFGVTSVLMYSSIFNVFRKFINKSKNLEELFSCSMCLGFWVASLCQWVFFEFNIWTYFVVAFASSGVTWLLCSTTQAMLWQKAYYEVRFSMYEKERLDRIKNKEQEING